MSCKNNNIYQLGKQQRERLTDINEVVFSRSTSWGSLINFVGHVMNIPTVILETKKRTANDRKSTFPKMRRDLIL